MQVLSRSIGDQEIQFERAKLGLWFQLEDLRDRIAEARSGESICAYLASASGQGIDMFLEAPWFEVVEAYVQVVLMNSPKIEFPILRGSGSSKDEVSWDYVGRSWIMWVHLLAKEYGWSVEYIENLEIEMGIGLIQEIVVSDQLQKEWQWSLSEIAYVYDKTTKTSKFRDLPRPLWMMAKAGAIKTTKLRKDLLPVGMVEDLSGMGLHGITNTLH